MKDQKGMKPMQYKTPTNRRPQQPQEGQLSPKKKPKTAPLLGLSHLEIIAKIEQDVAAFLLRGSIQILDVKASVEETIEELKEKRRRGKQTRKESNQSAFMPSRPASQEYIATERDYASKDEK